MNSILTVNGNTPKWPIQPCSGGACSTVGGCGLAVDQDNIAIYDNTLTHFHFLKWSDIQNRPGWNNGWPPGMGSSNGAVWKLIDFSDPSDAARNPISDARSLKCDCGAAAADYSISRDGGPGHSEWCKVANK